MKGFGNCSSTIRFKKLLYEDLTTNQELSSEKDFKIFKSVKDFKNIKKLSRSAYLRRFVLLLPHMVEATVLSTSKEPSYLATIVKAASDNFKMMRNENESFGESNHGKYIDYVSWLWCCAKKSPEPLTSSPSDELKL